MFFADLGEGGAISGDFVGDVDGFDDDRQVLGEEISFAAALSFWLFRVVSLRLRFAIAVAIFRRRLRLSHHAILKVEAQLGGIEAFAF